MLFYSVVYFKVKFANPTMKLKQHHIFPMPMRKEDPDLFRGNISQMLRCHQNYPLLLLCFIIIVFNGFFPHIHHT